jgi:dihydrofolate reductase
VFNQYDTLLMGRGTFQVAGGGGSGGDRLSVVVASRTLRPEDHPGVTIVASDLESRVRAMRQEPGKDIWLFGGADLFRSLLEMDLVDTVEVGIMPVLLGEGVPLVRPLSTYARLKLTRHVVYPKTGIVGLEYDVVPRRRRAAARKPTRRKK